MTLFESQFNNMLVSSGIDNTISGASGDDIIFALSGNDRILGNAGNDTLFGKQGDDVFVFGASPGDDIVQDFKGGGASDVLDFSSNTEIADFADIQARLTDVNGNAVITLNNGSITLTGVTSISLDADDFIF